MTFIRSDFARNSPDFPGHPVPSLAPPTALSMGGVMHATETAAASRPERRLVDVFGLALALGVPASRVRQMLRDGDLPSYRIGAKTVRFDVEEVLAILRTKVAS